MNAIPAVGFFEMLIVLVLGGGAGLPVSLPPAEPDPLLQQLAPQECLFYSGWSGAATPDGGSQNQLEQLLAEPEVRQFTEQLERELRGALLRMSQRDRDAAVAAQIVPTVAKVLLTRPALMYISDLKPPGPDGPPEIRAGVAINLGPMQAEVARLLRMIPEQATQPVSIGGVEFRRLQPPGPGAPSITFGIRGAYLMAALGDQELEQMLARAGKPAPAWLTELQQRFAVPRIATVTRVDVGTAIEKFLPLGGPPAQQIATKLGLANIKTLVSVSGLDDRGHVAFSAVDFNGAPTGVFQLVSDKPLTAADLGVIPRDPYIGVAVRADLQQILDTSLELTSVFDPRAAAGMDRMFQEMDQALGLSFRDDVIAPLGDVWTLHAHAEDGGLLAGWTATVAVKDRARVTQTLERLRQIAQQAGGGPRAPVVAWTKFMDHDIYHLSIPDDVPVAPAWCVTDSHLVVGLFPQAIKSHLLRRAAKGGTLADAPEVAAQLKAGGPLSLAYVDYKRIAELAYPFAQYGLRMAAGELSQEGVSVDFGLLPSLTSISKHLGPGVSVVRRTATGFESEQRQPIPGGNASASAPVTVALLLPAVQSARFAARRAQSQNNLKQIMLAMHNFHDTFKGFPALYGVGADNKPLLSWRVYILPFIEQQPLFEQFHLDEPWDSEHNKKLIERMPAVYRSPNSNAPPGHTTYLAISGESSALAPPKAGANTGKYAVGASLATITDGTSNTVGVVEANDGAAVPWTRPDDYKYSPQDPIRGLRGVYPNGVLAAFCDGSVRFLSEAVGKEAFNAYFTRNGGETVPQQ